MFFEQKLNLTKPKKKKILRFNKSENKSKK